MKQNDSLTSKLGANRQYISIKDQRYYLIGFISSSFGALIHALWIFLFYFLEAPVLAAFNLLSVTVFIGIFIFIRKGIFAIAVILAVIEVVIHQVLCVIYIGWDSGFQYYIIFTMVFPFLAVKSKKNVLSFFLTGVCIVTFLYLALYFEDATPIYSIHPIAISLFNYSNILFSMLLIGLCSCYFKISVNKAESALEKEQQRSEDLLHNILPIPIARRLKNEAKTIADGFNSVTVLFVDIVGFTEFSSNKSPEKLVELLNEVFSIFDDLAIKHNLEKIKTIGDAYMVAAGVPDQGYNDAERIAEFALDLILELEKHNKSTRNDLNVRVGINSGPVVAGVIGKMKFIYDLWGDAVNIASRMESHGLTGKIQVSESTFELLSDKFEFEKREEILVKGKGMMQTYILKEKKRYSDNQC
jgi:adenylate cyclase